MVVADIVLFFIPLFILLALLVLLGVFAFLARFRGGRYVRPIANGMAKIPFLRRLMEKASRAALERSNPELASAIRKLERSGAARDPQRAQAAVSRLSADERAAWLEAVEKEGKMPEPTNRQERRRLERLQQQQQKPRKKR